MILTDEMLNKLREFAAVGPGTGSDLLDTIDDLRAKLAGRDKRIHELEGRSLLPEFLERVVGEVRVQVEQAQQEMVSADRPFVYAIEDSKGNWKDGEQCVFGDAASAKYEVELLNDAFPEGDIEYKVVPLFRFFTPRIVHLRAELRVMDSEIGIYDDLLKVGQDIKVSTLEGMKKHLLTAHNAKRAEIVELEKK